MAHRRSRNGTNAPPVPPPPPTDYIPTPVLHTRHADDSFQQLMNPRQRLGPVVVHSVSSDRFKALGPTSPTPSDIKSSSSKRSTMKRFSRLGADMGKAVLETGKQALTREKPQKPRELSHSSSNESLYSRRRLPKLKIPDTAAAVHAALGSACSGDTEKSPNLTILGMSPTSLELHNKWTVRYEQADIVNEYRNMFSARRRVRKSPFGRRCKELSIARSGWDDTISEGLRDNAEDTALLWRIHDALQKQKDHATRLVQDGGAAAYPGFRPVSKPGCTKRLYWQAKSLHRHPTPSEKTFNTFPR